MLGNHDLHLLAVSAGLRTERPGDTIGEILDAPDADALLDWVRHRPFVHAENGMLLVHAGVLPQWDDTLVLEPPTSPARCARPTGATRCRSCTATSRTNGVRT